MSNQPEALRLALIFDRYLPMYNYEKVAKEAAAELRRLHFNFEAAKVVGIAQEGELMRLEAVNQKLLEVLELVLPRLKEKNHV
jgi:hypothetical protein